MSLRDRQHDDDCKNVEKSNAAMKRPRKLEYKRRFWNEVGAYTDLKGLPCGLLLRKISSLENNSCHLSEVDCRNACMFYGE